MEHGQMNQISTIPQLQSITRDTPGCLPNAKRILEPKGLILRTPEEGP